MSIVSEESLREPDREVQPRLHYIGEEDQSSATQLRRDMDAASKLAESHTWMVDRVLERTAARWPEAIDAQWVRSHAMVALSHTAARVESPEELPEEGVGAICERLRTLLRGTEWYRDAMLKRARPLCEGWRGAVLAGREPTDRTLCTRLRLSEAELIERYVELATVFAVEPAALLPRGHDVQTGLALALDGLPQDQKLVISLYFDQQLTLPEIARVLNVLPVRAQELLGRAAAAIAGEAELADWPAAAIRT